MSQTLNRKLSTFERIINNLWILVSFIPIVNGFGIYYIGAKTSNESLMKEGLVYEVPWILMFILSGLTNPANQSGPVTILIGFLALIAIFGIIVSIVRAVLLSPRYEKILEEKKYRKSYNKVISLICLIITCIPFINGIPFIYLGAKYSNSSLKKEGIIYEIPWVLTIFTAIITPFFLGIAFAFQIYSISRFIKLNYESSTLSVGPGPSVSKTESAPKDNAKDVQYHEYKAEKSETIIPDQSKPYEHYKNTIDDLTQLYATKENKTCDMVDERFGTSELTHERFMRMISNSNENFYAQRESALNIIELSSYEDPILEDKIKEKINFLELIIQKITDLQRELIINDNEDRKTDENIKILIDDMEDLIDSVKDYK